MIAAVGTLFVVWLVTGVRLMLLARRTRGLPEFFLGLALFLQAGIGYPLTVVAESTGDYKVLVTVLGSSCNNAGMGLLFVFTARVFHDGSRWAWVAVGAAGALLAVQAAGHVLGQAFATTPEDKLWALYFWGAGSLLLSGLSWGWTALETLRFHAQLRKRAALGLTDPVVANRMLLWGLAGCFAVGAVVIDTLLLYSGSDVARVVILPMVTAAAGLMVSVCMILAFWPPAAYLALVRRGAATAGA